MAHSSLLRVLLVEDSKILTEHILELLAEVDGIEAVGSVDSEHEAISFIERTPPDVVVLDLRLRQGTGFGVLERIQHLARKPRVIVMTNYALPEYERRAGQLGASCFLDKAKQFDQLPGVLLGFRRETNS